MTRAAAGGSGSAQATAARSRGGSKQRRAHLSAPEAPVGPRGYVQRSETPLTNLVFLLPLLLFYELGRQYYPSNSIVAFSLMQRFFAFFGATGHYLPALAVIGILLGCHFAQRGAWHLDWGDLWKMAAESVLLAFPLLLLWVGAGPYLARLPLYAGHMEGAWTVPCIGAGIYEELIFRLIILNLLSFLAIDLLGVPRGWGNAGIVIASAVLFSAYHYLGSEYFSPVTFVFRTIAGLYFAAVFLCRGFGITCGCHASYDLLAVSLPWLWH